MTLFGHVAAKAVNHGQSWHPFSPFEHAEQLVSKCVLQKHHLLNRPETGAKGLQAILCQLGGGTRGLGKFT